nr:hypothetical protein Iba_chr02dCG5250 [Ipomoea batatas]
MLSLLKLKMVQVTLQLKIKGANPKNNELVVMIRVLSTELSFALLRRYTPMNGTLPQIDGLRVEVTEDEVAIVLGFPWGTIGIDMMNGVGSVSEIPRLNWCYFVLHTITPSQSYSFKT